MNPDGRSRTGSNPGGVRLLRISVSGGQQTTTLTFEDNQTFQQYFETGSFTFTLRLTDATGSAVSRVITVAVM